MAMRPVVRVILRGCLRNGHPFIFEFVLKYNIMETELKIKIDNAIALLRRGEAMALEFDPVGGYHLGFSGGKDSQVLFHLALMSGVRFRAVYHVTTIDPPDNVRFIRDEYPMVVFQRPPMSFFDMVRKWGLPRMNRRFCCSRLKENIGGSQVVLTGVRADESASRSRYGQLEVRSRRVVHRVLPRSRPLEFMDKSEHKCIRGKDKVMLYPLLDWSASDVKAFHSAFNLPWNRCYSFASRVGCMWCPFAPQSQIGMYVLQYPRLFLYLLDAIEDYLRLGHFPDCRFGEEYFDWWLSRLSWEEYKRRVRHE